MKKIGFVALVLFLSLGMTGCYRFVAEHPEKSEKEFYEDQALCEEKARKYTQERLEDQTHSDEINHARRCMRELGWEYRFRRSSGE
ncbi:MAG: hypothetical protein MI863_16595 [Desulfobacterales bacterium]|nr:hypothetical protein [Desulfobacterales bacterium]